MCVTGVCERCVLGSYVVILHIFNKPYNHTATRRTQTNVASSIEDETAYVLNL